MKKEGKQFNSLKDYAKYSSIVWQMAIIILAGTFLGIKLDFYFQLSFPLFKLILIVLSVFLSLYVVFKNFTKKK